MPLGHLYVFFGEMSIWVSCPLFDCGVCCDDIKLFVNFVDGYQGQGKGDGEG